MRAPSIGFRSVDPAALAIVALGSGMQLNPQAFWHILGLPTAERCMGRDQAIVVLGDRFCQIVDVVFVEIRSGKIDVGHADGYDVLILIGIGASRNCDTEHPPLIDQFLGDFRRNRHNA
jgi:hypothetical protein